MISKRILFLLSLVSLLAVAGNAGATDLDEAVEAMRAGDFAEAYCIMRPLADSGDADAQYNVGWMYLNGYGLRVNDSLALSWWEKASEQGHSDASFSIGMLYSLGEGEVSKDSGKAIDYYLIAADDGHEDAVAILKSMMLRNDDFIRHRLQKIISGRESLFGVELHVKSKKLNARKGPSTKDKVVGRLLQGDAVIEINRQGRWSQVVVLENENIEKTVWVYNRFLE